MTCAGLLIITKWLAQQNAVKPIDDFGYKYAKYTEKEQAPFYSTKKKTY